MNSYTATNSYASTLYRNLTCGAASVLITFILSLTFVASTSVVPGGEVSFLSPVAHPVHPWLGQPEPAVLVD